VADDELRRRSAIDPAVAEILTGLERRRAEAHLPPRARQKKAQERAKAKARLPRRVNWDLPVAIKRRVNALAKEHQVPASQVAALLLSEGLRRLEAGELRLEAYRVPSKSPRYRWNLDLSRGEG